MSRRESGSRSSSTSRTSSNPKASSTDKGATKGPKVGRDGKVDVSCPQCGAEYRLAPELLETKIECSSCHRVFFAKTTAGKRAKPPDYTKVYVGFGIGALVLIGTFMMMSKSTEKPKAPPPAPVAKTPQWSRGTHPRTAQLVKWGQAVGSNNHLVLSTHSDLPALGAALEVADPRDKDAVIAAIGTHKLTTFLREMQCDSGELATDADMTGEQGTATLFVTPKPGDGTYAKNANGRMAITFKMDGEQVRVTGLSIALPPVRLSGVDPFAKSSYVPNKDINKPSVVEVADSAGTRKVTESKPAAVPHYSKATPEQQKLADEVVAGILKSADPEAPGTVFNRAVDRVRTIEERKAVVPRVLNAMFEHYGDVNANNQTLSQLNKALVTITGYAVNYQVVSSGDPQKDKTERESCVRQWFGFWYRYSENFEEFYSSKDPGAEEADDGKDPLPKKKSGSK